MADKYILRVTAGPGYNTASHVIVPVNTPDPVCITGANADIELNVRVQNYHGLPRNSPTTSPYFSAEPHAYNQDQYSICFQFTPKAPEVEESGGVEEKDDQAAKGISGLDLQFGNDFDHPIRDRLPPGFNTAMGIVRWWIDPGLDGDAYADRPYLYGPALSSFNALHVGPAPFDKDKGGIWVEEGGDEDARAKVGMPADAKARMKWALKQNAKEEWLFGYGKTYALDFFNPYLDFSSLSLRLPGFHLPIIKYWDGQGLRSTPKRSHQLRYVLRHKSTGEVYLVVLFTLYLKEDVNDDGTIKEGVDPRQAALATSVKEEEHTKEDEEAALKKAREAFGPAHGATETSADDVD